MPFGGRIDRARTPLEPSVMKRLGMYGRRWMACWTRPVERRLGWWRSFCERCSMAGGARTSQ